MGVKLAFSSVLAVTVAVAFGVDSYPPPEHTHIENNRHIPDAGYRWVTTPYEGASRFRTEIDFIDSLEERLRLKLAVMGKEVAWNPGSPHPRIAHVRAAGQVREWDADPGYTLTDKWEPTVVWTPKQPHPAHTHVIASQDEGEWVPEDGYIRVDSDRSRMTVAWAPHQSNHTYPHITSQADEGKWRPDSGYRFVSPEQSLQVVWTPNQPYPTHAHVISSQSEGRWLPEDGYSWLDPTSSSMAVAWKPRTASRFHPHITSQAEEGKWRPDPGYSFASQGFAVPNNMVRSVMGQLVQMEKVVHGWLGVSMEELTPELASKFGVIDTRGVLVSDVVDGSPAKIAGFQQADVIVKYDGKPMDSSTHLHNTVGQTPVGKKVTITFIRDKKRNTVDLTIGERPNWESQSVKIVWTPEQPDPAHAHLVAGKVEGEWVPQDGYDWVDPRKHGSSLVWTPNSKSHLHPHVLADKKEGDWVAEPGYRFVNPAISTSWDVVWVPQKPHPVLPHLLAGNREGDWVPEQGYHFEPDNNGNTVLAEGPEPSAAASKGGSSILGACAKGSVTYYIRDLSIQLVALGLDLVGCGGICSKVAATWTIPSTLGNLVKGCASGFATHITSD